VATAGPITAGVWPTSTDPLLADNRLFFLRGNGARVLDVAFSPIGWRIATADADGSVRTYDCVLCGGVAQLVPLAERRLAALDAQS
jgi:WD40 repeat protein